MKILAFSFYFPPHGGPGALRPLKMLKYAAPLGAEGVVVAAAEGDYSVRDASLEAEIPSEFMVVRTPPGNDPLRFFRRRMGGVIHAPKSDYLFLPDNKIWWINLASRLGVKALPNADIVWATCPPFSAALAARRAAMELRVPLVLDFRDSWTRNPNRPPLPFFHRAVNRMLATKAINSASAVTCVYKSIGREIEGLVPGKAFEVIPNGYDPEDMPPRFTATDSVDILSICYLGTIYPDLNYILPFLLAMKEVPEIKLSIVGRYPDKLKHDVSRFGLSKRVEFIDYREHRQALAIAGLADALLLYIDNRPLNLGQITSKTYEYMGLGKPILACIPRGGEADELLKSYSGGIRVTTECIGAIAQALQDLLDAKRTGTLSSPTPPPEFDRSALAERWFKLMQNQLKS